MSQFKQSWFTLSCLQLSGAVSLPIIMIGFYLGQHYSLGTSLLQILLGNLSLFVLAALYMRVINRQKQVTIEFAQALFGRSGTYLCAAGLVLSLIGWSAIQINLLAAITPQPSFAAMLIAGIIYFLTCRDLAYLARINKLVLPLLGASLIYLLVSMPHTEAFVFPRKNESWKLGFMMVITAGSGLVFDLPTFFRHAATPRAALQALAVIFLLSLPAIEGLGIHLALHFGNNEHWVKGFLSSFSLPSLFFLMVSGLSGACLNLYSATLVLNRLLGYHYRKTLLLLCSLSGLFAFVNLERHFSSFLELINLNAEIITVLILIYITFKGAHLPQPSLQQKKAHQVIFFLVLVYAGCSRLFQISLTQDLFLDVAMLSAVLMSSYCLGVASKEREEAGSRSWH